MIDLKNVFKTMPDCENNPDKLNAVLRDLYPSECKQIPILIEILQSGELNKKKSKIRYSEYQRISRNLLANGFELAEIEYGMKTWMSAFDISIDESVSKNVNIDNSHIHKYNKQVVAPTCKEQGYTRYWCDCGYEYKEDFSQIVSCDYVEREHKNPTCQEEGYSLSVCRFCGKEKHEIIPKIEHSYSIWNVVKKETCVSEGLKKRQCATCGKTDEQTIPKSSHSFGEWIERTHADCENSGESIRKCNVCGEIETKTVSALGHDYGEPYTDEKYPHKTLKFCKRCGHTDIEDDEETKIDNAYKELHLNFSSSQTSKIIGVLLLSLLPIVGVLIVGSTVDDGLLFLFLLFLNISVVLPIVGIGITSIYKCSSIDSIPDNKTIVETNAFKNKENLHEIYIPNRVTRIENRAFDGCNNLEYIILPFGVVSIGDFAFLSCTELTYAVIPDSVTSIGIGVFKGCRDLTLKVKKGSYAEKYAKDNGIKYIYY